MAGNTICFNLFSYLNTNDNCFKINKNNKFGKIHICESSQTTLNINKQFSTHEKESTSESEILIRENNFAQFEL